MFWRRLSISSRWKNHALCNNLSNWLLHMYFECTVNGFHLGCWLLFLLRFPCWTAALIWEKLGASDSTRLYYLASAVQRVLYTFIKDECGIRDPKPPRTPETLTAFLCTFFGGPFNLTGCTYYSRSTPRKILTSDYELLTEMSQLHEKLVECSFSLKSSVCSQPAWKVQV